VAAFDRGVDTDSGAGVALVGQGGQSAAGSGVQRAAAMGAGGGDVVTLPGSTGADHTGNPVGSATICTLPPWVLCLPEYHSLWPCSCGLRPGNVRDSSVAVYSGIDGAEGHHDTALADDEGKLAGKRRINESVEGVAELLALLRNSKPASRRSSQS